MMHWIETLMTWLLDCPGKRIQGFPYHTPQKKKKKKQPLTIQFHNVSFAPQVERPRAGSKFRVE